MRRLRLNDAKFNMICDVLKPTDRVHDTDVETLGHFETAQDDAGDIIRVWVDDTATTDKVEATQISMPCSARGVLASGANLGSTQKFSEIYENIEWVRIVFPAEYEMSKHDRVTNIRNKDGVIAWREEEMVPDADGFPPTVFSVKGVTPSLDPFGRHIENVALLERTEVQ